MSAQSAARRLATGAAATAALLLAVAIAAPAHAAVTPVSMHTRVDPGVARLGERVLYHGFVVFKGPSDVKWLPPEKAQDFTWGAPRAWRTRAASGAETLHVEIALQVFRVGTIQIPGLQFQEQDPAHPAIHRLPSVLLVIQPVLSAADSNAELRPPRAPIPAPWYERVPWRWVLLGLALLAAIVLLVRWLRSRKRAAPAVPERVLDPAARAMEELAALRALQLPEHGRFDEHAYRLSGILRRYLEDVTHAPRPGHTTPELVRALSRTSLAPDELQRLEALLRVWDRLKFGRASSSLEEARRFESAVEMLVQKFAPRPEGKAA